MTELGFFKTKTRIKSGWLRAGTQMNKQNLFFLLQHLYHLKSLLVLEWY